MNVCQKIRSAKTIFLSACLLVASANALAHGAGKSYIYSLSTRQQSSQILGVTGVPACVTVGGNRRGLYITAVSNGGNWKGIGLQPGDVLMTIDGQVMTDAAQADSALSSMGNGVRTCVFARTDDDGLPRFVTVRANILPGSRASGPSLAASGGARGARGGGTAGGGAETDSALASYVLDLINAERNQAHEPIISSSGALSTLANDYAKYLVQHNFFAHVDDKGRSPQDRAKEHGIQVGVYENLSLGSENRDGRSEVLAQHNTMMAEPAVGQNHRTNIMGEQRKYVGVGVARGRGKLILVEEFSDEAP